MPAPAATRYVVPSGAVCAIPLITIRALPSVPTTRTSVLLAHSERTFEPSSCRHPNGSQRATFGVHAAEQPRVPASNP